MSYTAREDAGAFKNRAITHLREYFRPDTDEAGPSLLMLDLRRDFPTEWSRFLHPADAEAGHVLELEMSHEPFPFRDRGQTLKISRIQLLARSTEQGPFEVTMTPPFPEGPSNSMALTNKPEYGGLLHGEKNVLEEGVDVSIMPADPPVTWRLKITSPPDGALLLNDLILVLEYRWE